MLLSTVRWLCCCDDFECKRTFKRIKISRGRSLLRTAIWRSLYTLQDWRSVAWTKFSQVPSPGFPAGTARAACGPSVSLKRPFYKDLDVPWSSRQAEQLSIFCEVAINSYCLGLKYKKYRPLMPWIGKEFKFCYPDHDRDHLIQLRSVVNDLRCSMQRNGVF